MDFWKVDGRQDRRQLGDLWTFPHVLAQLGVDVFNGEGWEAYDRGERIQAPD